MGFEFQIVTELIPTVVLPKQPSVSIRGSAELNCIDPTWASAGSGWTSGEDPIIQVA
jgi:hypothetical protein